MDAIELKDNPRKQIETFVFFDIETTDLIRGSNIPDITEISFVATSWNSIFNGNGSIPRATHKLTIPVKPVEPIVATVSKITGLNNNMLKNEKTFDISVFQLINSFISTLCPPVCLVAHNGNNFDYPILLSALKRVEKSFSEDVLCVDSLNAFQKLLAHMVSPNHKKIILSKPARGLKLLDNESDVGPEIVYLANVTPVCPDTNGVNVITEKQEMSPKSPLKYGTLMDFKLPSIHKYLVGTPPPNFHCAEADCLSLLTCVMKIGRLFVRWADRNASPLMQCSLKRK